MKKLLIFSLMILSFAYAQEIGAKYLVITADTFYNSILPYAQWKHKMGLRTKVVKLSEIGGNNQVAIRNYIRNAYNTWPIKPEFLLLVGGPSFLAFPIISSTYTDNYYTNIDTTNIYNEILSGRLTVRDINQAQTVVSKMLRYERNPDTTTDWFRNACLIVREDNDPYDDSIYWSDIHHAKALMLGGGYNTIDTLSRNLGNNANDVISRVNQGRGFVLYRGQGVGYWWDPFNVNPNLTQNGSKLPIVLSITCRTIATSGDPATAEWWLLTGTPTTPRGGAGYFATTTIVTGGAYLRSAVCKGFFNAIFNDRKRLFGEACEAGRRNVYQLYGSQSEYRGFTTLGDPAMQIWTAKPKRIDVFYDSILYAGVEETLQVSVQYQGMPVESAYVCILFDTLIYQTGYTNYSGQVSFILNSPIPGTMDITVTGRNLYPYEGTIQMILGDVYLTYLNSLFSDSLGNNNGFINQGEIILLWATIRNIGAAPATNVRAKLKTQDTTIFITDSISLYGNVLPGTDQIGLNPFVFSVSPNARSHSAPFEIYLIDAQGDTFYSNFSLFVSGNENGAIGPDPYGYYIYDDTDTLTGNAPVYNWFEIAPPGPGLIVSEITDEDADTVTYPLPFVFKYYGTEYNTIGLCSNGFLELNNSTYRFGENTPIPLPGGPKRLLAPFWDDLDPRPAPDGYGDIYYYSDTTNHRWIIEYKECGHYGNPTVRETFQAILLDPQYYPTPTGDGEVLFLYNTVANANENSVGMEDETETRGLQYVYNSSYDPNAMPLINGRALLITTKPPVSYHSPWINLMSWIVNDSSGGNNNGIPEPNETIEITIYIRNDGDTLITDVNGSLRTSSNSLLLIDSTAIFGNVEIGAISDNSSNPYIVQVAEDPVDTLVGLTLYFTGNGGGYQTFAYFTLHIHNETGISENSTSNDKIELLKIYPNPFKNRLEIRYKIPDTRYEPISDISFSLSVSIKIYDVAGRLVKDFSRFTNYDGHPTSIVWDGTDDSGLKLPAGIYFIRLESNEFKRTEKAVLLR
uniref:T9SS type A sorting domain-containing protein n=1 Tax=candidate division WOR-3 bacterium TaxID=2052148 RepID=A0A7C4XB42_UNCW3